MGHMPKLLAAVQKDQVIELTGDIQMAEQFPEFDMVTKTPHMLRVWRDNLNEYSQSQVITHLGHLPSLMDFKAYPALVQAITRYWDSENMVFKFGNVEITPTVKEIRDCLESKALYDKRKEHPNRNVLIPNRPTSKEIKNMLFLVQADWLDTPNIPFIKFFERWGHRNYFGRFPNEFHDYSTWVSTQDLAFSICLLGAMVFPQDQINAIDSRIVMATNAIFYGIGKDGQKKYCDLAPVILADIYRSLSICKVGFHFFQGCNLLLQWWMSHHLAKKAEKWKQKLGEQDGGNILVHHELMLTIRNFKMGRSRKGWAQVLSELGEDNVCWMFDHFMSKRIAIQGRRFPFLVLMGIRGMRPYYPNRVMRQFGRTQVVPKRGDTSQFVIDYEGCDRMPYVDDIRKEWPMCAYLEEKSIAKDRYDAGYDAGYKEWLNMQQTLTPGPHLNPQLEDEESRVQIQSRLFQQQWEKGNKNFNRSI